MTNILASLVGLGRFGLRPGNWSVAFRAKASQRSDTGQESQRGWRVQTVAPRSMTAWV